METMDGSTRLQKKRGPKGKGPRVRIALRLPPELHAEMRAEMDRTGCPAQDILQTLLAEHVGRPDLAPQALLATNEQETLPLAETA